MGKRCWIVTWIFGVSSFRRAQLGLKLRNKGVMEVVELGQDLRRWMHEKGNPGRGGTTQNSASPLFMGSESGELRECLLSSTAIFYSKLSPCSCFSPILLLRDRRGRNEGLSEMEKKFIINSTKRNSYWISPPVFVFHKEVCFLPFFIRHDGIYFPYGWRETQGLDASWVTSLYFISSDGPELISCLKKIILHL